MTLDQLAELEKALPAGPWFAGDIEPTAIVQTEPSGYVLFRVQGGYVGSAGAEELTARLAALRNAAPALIEIAESLYALLEDTQHAEHECDDPDCVVARARVALRAIEEPK